MLRKRTTTIMNNTLVYNRRELGFYACKQVQNLQSFAIQNYTIIIPSSVLLSARLKDNIQNAKTVRRRFAYHKRARAITSEIVLFKYYSA